MAQWNNTDNAANSVLWGVTGYNKAPTGTNRDSFFGNTTQDAYYTNMIVGQFGASNSEVSSSNGSIHSIVLTFNGSGYNANAVVTVSGGGGTDFSANAQANSTGRISAINIANNGADYKTAPTLTVAAPAAISFSGNTSNVSIGSDTIDLGATGGPLLANGDLVQYLVAAGNTAIGGLSNASSYYVVQKAGNVIKLATDPSGAAIDLLTANSTAPQAGHSLTGQTAVAVGVLSLGKHITHAGWVNRTVGTGGRAGRVQYETLVASSSVTGDGTDDTILKDL